MSANIKNGKTLIKSMPIEVEGAYIVAMARERLFYEDALLNGISLIDSLNVTTLKQTFKVLSCEAYLKGTYSSENKSVIEYVDKPDEKFKKQYADYLHDSYKVKTSIQSLKRGY